MEIHSTGGISGPDPVQPNRIANRIVPTDITSAQDRAEISDVARFKSLLRDVPPIRQEKVTALKALIASGKYETPERIAGAVNGLLEELGEVGGDR